MNVCTGRPGSALLAIHWQNEVMHVDGKIRAGFEGLETRRKQVLAASGELLKIARKNNLPVIYLRMAFRTDFADLPDNCPLYRRVADGKMMGEGSWGAQFHKGLEPASGDWIVTHNRVNGFYASQLEAVLSVLGVKHLFVAGIATNSAVEHTVRHAADMGYQITVVENACSCAPFEAHRASLDTMRPLAEIATLYEVSEFIEGPPNDR